MLSISECNDFLLILNGSQGDQVPEIIQAGRDFVASPEGQNSFSKP